MKVLVPYHERYNMEQHVGQTFKKWLQEGIKSGEWDNNDNIDLVRALANGPRLYAKAYWGLITNGYHYRSEVGDKQRPHRIVVWSENGIWAMLK